MVKIWSSYGRFGFDKTSRTAHNFNCMRAQEDRYLQSCGDEVCFRWKHCIARFRDEGFWGVGRRWCCLRGMGSSNAWLLMRGFSRWGLFSFESVNFFKKHGLAILYLQEMNTLSRGCAVDLTDNMANVDFWNPHSKEIYANWITAIWWSLLQCVSSCVWSPKTWRKRSNSASGSMEPPSIFFQGEGLVNMSQVLIANRASRHLYQRPDYLDIFCGWARPSS